MDDFAGLDISVNETSVCVVDETGWIVRKVKVASEPDALLLVLANPACRFKRIGRKLVRSRNGYSALLPKQSYRSSVLKRGTCTRC
jgi:hypothetical protein